MGHRPRYVLLLKDRKPICRTMLHHMVEMDVPSRWHIDGFEKQLPPHLQCFPLYPEAETDSQNREWGVFLNFLRKRKLVATVQTELHRFYVLPSQGKLNHAIVHFREKDKQSLSENHESKLVEHSSPCNSESTATVTNVIDGRYQARAPELPAKLIDANLQKNFIKTDPSYLVTLAQSHAGWIFGAIAELVDNARDANAAKQEGKKIPVLSVVDDGNGMCHSDVVRMLSFGHKQPEKEDLDHIGRFGIGFKTGSMKIGRDALVLTQTPKSRTVAFLSQTFNRNMDNLEVPIVSYFKNGHYMDVDLSIQTEDAANSNLKAIKDYSPFNEYFIGEKLGMFGESGSGTQIYIWNLDEWGSNFSLEWGDENFEANSPLQNHGDILIRSRRIRSRPGQISREVPLDYSLRAYLEVLFLEPHMEICLQRHLVKSQSLLESLKNIVVVEDVLMGRPLKLTLGQNQVEWQRMNCGMFLYWHGRLIEAYKRVGGMIHNADMGRGIIGVVDVTGIMNDGNGRVWVLNNKQGFQDCEAYTKLEEWLGQKFDEFWDAKYDLLDLRNWNSSYKHDHEWVQCNKCHKWRILGDGYDSSSLPLEWFCYMPPFSGRCEIPEQQVDNGVVTVATKRSGYNSLPKVRTKHEMKVLHEENAEQPKSSIKAKQSERNKLYQRDMTMRYREGKMSKYENYHQARSNADSSSDTGKERLWRAPPMNYKHF